MRPLGDKAEYLKVTATLSPEVYRLLCGETLCPACMVTTGCFLVRRKLPCFEGLSVLW
jgi:hypothetical protein